MWDPLGGKVESSRGKKGKKAVWHLTLGLKDTIFAGIGVVGLMMISFALGALAGRGDIYRVASSWGLLTPEGAKVVQMVPPGTVPQVLTQSMGAGSAPVAATPAAPASGPSHPSAHVATAPKHAAPVTGSIAGVPAATASSKKKSKASASARERKAREEELHRLRQEVAAKLKFQNSFDTAPKPPKASGKQAKNAPAPAQVKVAQYRDAKSAKAKVAELHKKGIKATVKQGKDKHGAYYAVYRLNPAKAQESEKLVQKKGKAAANQSKTNSH
jgi:hypothetical protein